MLVPDHEKISIRYTAWRDTRARRSIYIGRCVLCYMILFIICFAMLTSLLIALLLVEGSFVHAQPCAKLYGLVPGKPKLTFRKDGSFKVVSFSDMHYGENNGESGGTSANTELKAMELGRLGGTSKISTRRGYKPRYSTKSGQITCTSISSQSPEALLTFQGF